ncbi:sugar-binding transcriptional regulator [Luxibacter massiliensis]|uniref:sugar-binding transcriptional regulator n=1 Tax=Luxibacter massiliensis TaxID=2219695 RepID=UPI000F06F6CE|nr:sugar-binding transcriptional regulator [Luxibacter massiliensis]
MKKENMTEEQITEYRRVAFYYYKGGLTQEEIAKKMKMSRQRVNRIIKACVELGIVKITIENMDESNLEIENRIEQKFQLKEVRLVDNIIEENIYCELGDAAGRYLQTLIQNNTIIGFTRGRATSALVDSIPGNQRNGNITVTQLIGNTSEEQGNMGVDEVIYRFAEKFHARTSRLYAPVIVKNKDLKTALTEEPYYKEAYGTIQKCDIAVVGIGTAKSQWKHMVSLYDTNDAKQAEWAKNVVGEVCTHFFDAEGKVVIPPFSDRIIAISLDDYMKIPVRIGVAGSLEKKDAIRAALKGGYVNVLITDLQTAKELL